MKHLNTKKLVLCLALASAMSNTSFADTIAVDSSLNAQTKNHAEKHSPVKSSVVSCPSDFQQVKIAEPTIEKAVIMLRGIKSKYEEHHKLEISDDALVSAAEMSDRYISDRALPDKAIDLFDESASRVRLRRSYTPPSL
ncbi:hypothetical protein, partial [Alteromonas abrolhosensis]|uniref:hypothetical protein n=1 Tax=Alteromonas abrolhosensis TaxID=1892904 RepID=UPI003BACC644